MSVFTRALAQLYRINHDLRVIADRLDALPWWAWRRRRRLQAILLDGLTRVGEEIRRTIEEERERKVAAQARVYARELFAQAIIREHANCCAAGDDEPAVDCIYCRDDAGRAEAADLGVVLEVRHRLNAAPVVAARLGRAAVETGGAS